MEHMQYSLGTEFGMPWMDSFEGMIGDLTSEYETAQPSPSHSSYVDASAGHGHSSPTHSSYFDVSTTSHSPTDSYVDTLDSGSQLMNKSLYSELFDQECNPFPNLFQSPGVVRLDTKDTGFFQNSASHRQPGFETQLNYNSLSSSGSSGITEGSINAFSPTASMSTVSRDTSMRSFPRDAAVPGALRDAPIGSPVSSPMGNRNPKQTGEKYHQFGQQCLPQQVVQQTRVGSGNCYAPQPQPAEVRQKEADPEVEESGVRLVHLLLSCAESIQRRDLVSAESTVRNINFALTAAPPQTGAMGRVAAHFVEALTRRIYGISSNSQESLITGIKPEALSELLHFHFYEMCPYLKFAHFTANQAILEAFRGEKYVHVIDFNLNHGLQWPALIQALALRHGGPPVLRLTGIGPPEAGGQDSLKEIGMSLAQLAESVSVKFEFRGVRATKLDDIQPWMLQVRPGEAVAVNSMMQLHKLLYSDASVPAGIDEVLRSIRTLNPKIVTISEHEANHNSPNFLDRFMEALHFYSSMFDSLEPCKLSPGSSEQMLAEMYLGREICNIVATEGVERTERHETLEQWRLRMRNSGFKQIHMGPNAFKQASMLLTLFSGDGYRVEDSNGCLTLGWYNRPLIASSAWRCC